MKTKFKTLRLFAIIQIALGILCLVAAVVGLLILLGMPRYIDERVLLFMASSYGVLLIIGLIMTGIASIAYGQFLQVVMQIEQNTRKEEVKQ